MPQPSPLRVLVIETDASVRVQTLEATANDPHLLEALQAIVGGMVEQIRFGPDCHAFLNEEGKALALPANTLATRLAGAWGAGLDPRDIIAGRVVLTGVHDEDGFPSPWVQPVPYPTLGWLREAGLTIDGLPAEQADED